MFQTTLDEYSPALSNQPSCPQVLEDLTELAVIHYELRMLASSLSSALFVLKDYDYSRRFPTRAHALNPEHEAEALIAVLVARMPSSFHSKCAHQNQTIGQLEVSYCL